MTHRHIYEIENDERALRHNVRLALEAHSAVFEELLRAQEWYAFINGEDQRCARCGKKLEKWRNGKRRWTCLECQGRKI
jgi:formamidopyrimidine-DNA glycosylase